MLRSNTARMALAMIGAIERTVNFSKFFSGGIGSVLQTTTFCIGDSSRF